MPYWSKEPAARPLRIDLGATSANASPAPNVFGGPAVLLGPSVLAGLGPAPDLNLSLPRDVATVAARRGINGETGLIPTAASITTFRLTASGDLVSVAPLFGVDPVRPAAGATVFTVHGQVAVASDDRGVAHIRWTENGITYDVASRTLDAVRLAEVANKLR